MKLEANLKTPFKIVTHGVVFKQGKRVSEHTFVQDTFKIYICLLSCISYEWEDNTR